ncbi:hypothetical protein J4Q44_G00191400 [Coregonus suidteri]|uniref:Uncharacterized protein n=1 Tax=Coregonus suidteri TaxID=861788 RepID=A0AAN8LGZ8_9TELE
MKKCIQQSIYVDLSEDESLHFSDLEGSFKVNLSQAESAASGNSIHLNAPHPDITQLLLRHFSKGELLCSGRLIEAETLPEVSLLESMEETVLSRGPWRSSTGSPIPRVCSPPHLHHPCMRVSRSRIQAPVFNTGGLSQRRGRKSRSMMKKPSQTLTTSQRMVTPETDSGFGSSDLSRPATGLSQPKLDTERSRLQFQCDGTASPRVTPTLPVSSVTTAPLTNHSPCTASPWSRHGHAHICSCYSEVMQALQSEVSQLRRDLEGADSLTNTNSKKEDWISSDTDHSKSKGINSVESDRSGNMLPFYSTPLGGRRGSSKPYSCSDRPGKTQSKKHSNTASEENCSLETPVLRPSSPPALQSSASTEVIIGSSCRLPAGFCLTPREELHPVRLSSTDQQCVLPAVTSPPALNPPPPGPEAEQAGTGPTRTLGRAIEADHSMKRTTERMAKSLSADLAEAELYRK